ncbi:MAG: Protein transport protein S9 plasma membrane t-SNARE [Vezdaea aestivalis]|nr:MAG: Protein transport protein S9 plasma membrane t-SNARE [Vezdaea aestivalis]
MAQPLSGPTPHKTDDPRSSPFQLLVSTLSLQSNTPYYYPYPSTNTLRTFTMKKFGFSKKDKSSGGAGEDDSSNRSALFGSRSRKAPAQSNPYAQAPPNSNPYAQNSSPDPYAADTNKYSNMGKPYADRGASYGGGPSRDTQGGYGAGQRGQAGQEGYGSGGGSYGGPSGYGGSSGYGGDQYGSRGPGGYGGLGRTTSNSTTNTDDNRSALFGGAQDRYAQRGPPPSGGYGGPGGPQGQDDGYGGGGAGQQGGYGAYDERRQLTAEEAEEEDIEATKQEIRFMKREDVDSTRRALQIAAQAEETGRSTLERLGAQGERLHNTEANLDLSANQNRVAEERARELKTLNKSMFALHVSNPLTSASRKAARDDDILATHQKERDRREKSRQEAYGTQQRMEGAIKATRPGAGGGQKMTQRDRAKMDIYRFEDSDSADENDINDNLDALSGAAGRLNKLARATGDEVDAQNRHLDRIAPKIDDVDDKLAMNRARLNRIH